MMPRLPFSAESEKSRSRIPSTDGVEAKSVHRSEREGNVRERARTLVLELEILLAQLKDPVLEVRPDLLKCRNLAGNLVDL